MLILVSFMSLLAYMIVGEKMPWLTVHISWSMLLLTGWLIGKLLDRVDWKELATKNLVITILSTAGFILIIPRIYRLFISAAPPFAGKELTQVAKTSEFLLLALLGLSAVYLIIKFTRGYKARLVNSIFLLTLFGILGGLTARHAGLASYKNYDLANEYLVYAHAARGPKDALEQIESISLRQTGGKEIKIAMDNHTPYPFWWYLRDYPNRYEYREEPTRELRNYPIILAGDGNYHLIEPIVQDDYIAFEYPRMVWPNQDYFNLSFYSSYLENSETRAPMLDALADIWLHRDFTKYGEVTGQDVSPVNWNPSQSFKMYVRKDIAAQVWQFGALAASFEVAADPYTEAKQDLTPTLTFSDLGLNGPKGIAVAPDGSIYVADTGNNRIVHISQDGSLLDTWGSEGSAQGEFNQPWGLTVDPDGYVYVADTWNHRIQKFTPAGEFITTWGQYGQEIGSAQFWGPRDVVINSEGQVIVSDTGNKRIHTFSAEGDFIDAFGSAGYQPAEFDEPVGLAISPTTRQMFVADTWNQRVQVFSYGDDIGFVPAFSWDVDAWYGQSLDNKPYLDVDLLDRVYVADPEAARVIVFGIDGTFLSTFGDYDPTGFNGFGLIGGIAVDNIGGVWVTDSLTNQIKHFIVP
jgi:DNA-binding beta-propeller fold protein YncE